MSIYVTVRRALAACCIAASTILCQGQSTRFYDQSAMSSSMLSSIAQDAQGYLWIGSNYGLMRFDGNSFKSWIHTDNKKNTLVDNRVLKVLVVDKDIVCIATANGLQTYNQTTRTFTLAKLPNKDFNGYISDVCKTSKGTILCIASGVGIYELNKTDNTLTPTLTNVQKLSWFNQLNHLIEIAPNSYLFSGQHGEVAIVKDGKTTERKLCDAPIATLIKDGDGNIIIVSNYKVWRYKPKENSFTELYYSGNNSIIYKDAYCSKSGTIYISTSGAGITQVAKNSSYITPCTKWSNTSINIAKAKLNVIYEDKKANLWVGCTNKGLLMAQDKRDQFRFLSVDRITSGDEGYIQDLAYDKGGSLWCSVEDFGAFKISERGEIMTRINTPLQINRLHAMNDGTMVAGVNNRGVYAINTKTNALSPIATIEGSYSITAITSDKSGNIYAAIDGRGIIIVDAKTKAVKWLRAMSGNLMINNWIPALCIDNKNRLWIGHYSGLSCFDLNKNTFIKLNNDNGLRQAVCNDIISNSGDNIWIATSQGLVRYNAATNEWSQYTYDNGLGDNAFMSLVADANGNIWATTRNGMNKFDTKSLKFTAFYGGDGLDDNAYNRVATNANSNRISFAGQGGITAFQPANMKATTLSAMPTITDISVKGLSLEQMLVENKKFIENDGDNQVKKINVGYADNALSLILSTLDFRYSNNICYQYKFAKSSTWISSNVGQNSISINNLTPGDYTLQIRACENGVYSPIREVEICVSAPWFMSTIAKIVYLLLIIGICGQVYITLKRKRDNQIKEAKLQFFINISHEIRSPLTLILSPLEALMKQEFDAKTTQRLTTIHRNATRILNLVNQLLDIRKIDKGKMEIHCTETDLVPFIDEFTEMFKQKAEDKQIRLTFNSSTPEVKAWIDRHNFDKVLINLLSNAFKYTPNGGEISIELSEGADNKVIGPLRQYAMIRVIDSGIGIDVKKAEKIFERFYQDNDKIAAENPSGFGIGLNLCKLLVELHHGTIKAYNRADAQGSCFEVKIPLGSSHLTKQEKAEETTNKPRQIITDAIIPDATPKMQKNVRHRSNYHILVVDDDKEIRDYLSAYFAAYYKVDAVADGDEAWKYILDKGTDLVISDVNMPGINGIQLLKNVKSNGNTNHIPVILLTSNTDYANRKEGWEKGADAYLPKPFNGEELLAIADSLIENRIMLRGRFSGAQSQEDKIDKIEVKSNNDVLMNKIIEMINAHIDDPNLNVEMLGQEVGISRAHLHRKMKDMIGVSPSDFIRNIRLRKACELLKDTDNDVTQIAYSIGFTSQTHFSTAFKKFMGVSPSEYRAKNQGH